MKVVTADKMREIDRIAIKERGIPSWRLMENAGTYVYETIKKKMGSPDNKGFFIFAGKGNNGGDGFVVARLLQKNNGCVKVFLIGKKEEVKGDAERNLSLLQQMRIEILEISSIEELNKLKEELKSCSPPDLIVDALLGTGTKGEVAGVIREVIELINALKVPVISIDIPSGIDANKGIVLGAAVRATWTVTMGLPKIGLTIFPGAEYCGELIVGDIGFPRDLIEDEDIRLNLITEDLVRKLIPIPRPPSAHKGEFGRILILAGSRGYTGAAYLCSQSAMVSGAGLVYLGIPESLNSIMEVKLTEVITLPLPETKDCTFSLKAIPRIKRFIEDKKIDALALGPGISTQEETVQLVQELLPQIRIPIVLDADGINAISKTPDIIKECSSTLILTPHPGEAARLFKTTTSNIQENRVEFTQKASKEFNSIFVLKGARTIISEPKGDTFINPTGNPGMAKGGTGDVLTGMITAFIGQKLSPISSAITAVYLHGLASDLAVIKKGEMSLLATDIIEYIPKALSQIMKE